MTERSLRIEPGSPSWPGELEHIENPPGALWLRGRRELLAVRPRVAIVGSRSPTPYGVGQAQRFATELAHAGVSVVSGLARGIDEAAHTAAVAAGGATLAVLGSGVDRPWPDGPALRAVLEGGLLLSELRPGTGPRRHHFPLRNRLISALSEIVLVVEAAASSGSLITARWAAHQGRSVCAIPGRVDHPMARGTHRLIREGATLVESPEELLDELFGPAARPPRATRADGRAGATSPRLGARAERLLAALVGETLTAGELGERLGLDVPDVLVDLVELELLGAVVRGPGGLYRRTR